MMSLHHLVSSYQSWLKEKTALKEIHDGWTEVTTSFIDRHNDYIQIYIKIKDGKVVITDDGYTLNDLDVSGVNVDSNKKRLDLLNITLNGFGVKREGDALVVYATPENFPMRKHNLIQAMLAVNDLFYVATPYVASLFKEDVQDWLDLHEIRFLSRVKFSGASGYDHVFDFVIPRSRIQPERIIRALSNPSRDKAESFAFAWHDTRETRDGAAIAYAVVNDNERPAPPGVRDALNAYDINIISWSEREKYCEQLRA